MQCTKSPLTAEQTCSDLGKRLATNASDLHVKANRLLVANGENHVPTPLRLNSCTCIDKAT
ncbi:MAG: hypothetical protein QGG00_12280, partial [Verrucomicrobiota bacterium]|nr:hypothetical protein [Verrucomicrobiota bacterium]